MRASSRWGGRVSRHFTVVTYTGRRSGRTFSTPVGYRRTGSTVTIPVSMPERKTWWRNFTGDGGPVSLNLDGNDRTGLALAEVNDKSEVTVTVRLDHWGRAEDWAGEAPAQ
ncbi:MAG TPA: nitroreductase/quinone reductase family protein [Trebonia sp.]